jgi:hypothetical protein
MELTMHHRFLASWLVGLSLLGLGACADFPQPTAPANQAGQGGYLGKDPGEPVTSVPPPARMATIAAGWCVQSPDPGRCRSRAASDHQWCMAQNPDRYDNCRRMMDFVGWHN